MKNSLANIQNRRAKLVEFLTLHPNADVSSIAQSLAISKATVRRDLNKLSEEKIVARYYGGAKLLQDRKSPQTVSPDASGSRTDTEAFPEVSENLQELHRLFPARNEAMLRAIARQAASFIHNNDIVFLNSSRTASFVIDYITADNVTVVTNNLLALTHFYAADNTISLILTGGQISKKAISITGGIARNEISKIVANKCILGVRGISAEYGITSPELEESYVNQKMLAQTDGQVIIVAEGYKVGKKDKYYINSVSHVSYLITDKSASPKELNALSRNNVKTILVDAASKEMP